MSLNLDALAHEALTFEVTLGRAQLDEAADLTRRILQAKVRASGGLLPPALQRTYAECSETERDGMRSAVCQVLVSLCLLGIVDKPG